MTSRVATMVLAGTRPTAHAAPSSAADTERRAWRTRRLSLNRRGRGTRGGLIARASHRPLCAAEGVIQWLRSAAAALAIAAQISVSMPADAVLYSPDTKIPRTGELALRKAIPANPNMKIIQESLEDISYLLRIPQRKPYGTMEGDVKKAMKIAMDNKEAILGSIPAERKEDGAKLYTSLLEEKGGLQTLLKYIKENNPDKLSIALAASLDTIAELELLQAPGLSFLLPQQYLEYPRLTGRGVVEFTVEKGDGSTFFPTGGGEPKSTATIQVVIDGYSAPLTAGNFAKLVLDGAYDGVTLKCASQAITADNETGKKGYTVPLEVMPAGQFKPLYRTPLSILDGELPVLPMSVYGAVAMAHSVDSDEYSSPTQFFFYLYDKRNSGLGGISFDEGQFSVFGYTTDGRDVLAQIKTGDKIRSAKLVQGVIARDHQGEVKLAAWRVLFNCASADEAEAAACVEGIRLATEWCHASIILESDSARMAEALTNITKDRSEIAFQMEEGKELARLLDDFKVAKVNRTSNCVAHELAALARRSSHTAVWLNQFPTCVLDTIAQDCNQSVSS